MMLSTLHRQHASLPKRLKAGLHSIVTYILQENAEHKTRVVNKTGCKLVLRSKYRNVWEGEHFTLGPGESVRVRWAPMEPYQRLGAFVDTGSFNYMQQQEQLLIAQHTLASNKEIVLLRSPSLNHLSLSMSPRLP